MRHVFVAVYNTAPRRFKGQKPKNNTQTQIVSSVAATVPAGLQTLFEWLWGTGRTPVGKAVNQTIKPTLGKTSPREHGGYSLRLILALAFGTLVAVSVGTVLFISVAANFRNTYSLLNERAITLIKTMEQSIRLETSRAESAVNGLADMHATGAADMLQRDQALIALQTILASETVIEGLIVRDPQGGQYGLVRQGNGKLVALRKETASGIVPSGFEGKPFLADTATWGVPVEIDGQFYHNVSRRLGRTNEGALVITALLGRSTMNGVLSKLGQDNETTAFVLDGSNNVIGHSKMGAIFGERNFVPIADIPDPALQDMKNAVMSEEFEKAAAQGITVFRSSGFGGYIYISKQLPGYTAVPYVMGAYFAKADLGAEVKRALFSLFAGLAGLAAAVVASAVLGKWISAPMARIAATAGQLSDFRIDDIEPLPRSAIREIDDQTIALNRMHVAIGEFSKYVPRTLVSRLVKLGASASKSVEKEVTVLFTDIAGFTTLSEHLDATRTASILNEHFDIICPLIESCGGTVDKFMGDGVMAFWGAPEEDPEHIKRAVGAAKKIVEAMHVHNLGNHNAGRKPIRIRIGIHTGRAIVGNIGGGGRQNYTLVGDTVNVAQRLEQMGHQIMQDNEEALVLVSSPVVLATKPAFAFKPTGNHTLRGRARPVAVFRLDLSGKTTAMRGKRPSASKNTGAKPA